MYSYSVAMSVASSVSHNTLKGDAQMCLPVLCHPRVIQYNRPACRAAGDRNVRQNWRREGRTVPVGVSEILH